MFYNTAQHELHSSDESTTGSEQETLLFDITFSSEEWEIIKPKEKVYKHNDGTKKYNILTPYEWSNTVQKHFFLHTRLPCSLVFKKANVNFYGVVYIFVIGRCKDCGSVFDGTVDSIPASGTRLVLIS